MQVGVCVNKQIQFTALVYFSDHEFYIVKFWLVFKWVSHLETHVEIYEIFFGASEGGHW